MRDMTLAVYMIKEVERRYSEDMNDHMNADLDIAYILERAAVHAEAARDGWADPDGKPPASEIAIRCGLAARLYERATELLHHHWGD